MHYFLRLREMIFTIDIMLIYEKVFLIPLIIKTDLSLFLTGTEF